jgi:hypothetical protein
MYESTYISEFLFVSFRARSQQGLCVANVLRCVANLFLSAHPVNKALVSFLDLDRTGKMRLEDVCTLLLR